MKRYLRKILRGVALFLLGISLLGLVLIPWGWKRSYTEVMDYNPMVNGWGYGYGYRHLFLVGSNWYIVIGGKKGEMAIRYLCVRDPYSIAPGSITEDYGESPFAFEHGVYFAPTGKTYDYLDERGTMAGPRLGYPLGWLPFQMNWTPAIHGMRALEYGWFQLLLYTYAPGAPVGWEGNTFCIQAEMPYSAALALDFLCVLLSGWKVFHIGDRIRAKRRNRALADQKCPVCGYDTRAQSSGEKCPECGTVIGAGMAQHA